MIQYKGFTLLYFDNLKFEKAPAGAERRSYETLIADFKGNGQETPHRHRHRSRGRDDLLVVGVLARFHRADTPIPRHHGGRHLRHRAISPQTR